MKELSKEEKKFVTVNKGLKLTVTHDGFVWTLCHMKIVWPSCQIIHVKGHAKLQQKKSHPSPSLIVTQISRKNHCQGSQNVTQKCT
jgi:hypothetical protein